MSIAAIIVAATVWCYWLSVLVMIGRSHVLHRTSAGALPRTGLERWMWTVWVPTILAWLALPWLGFLAPWPLVRVTAELPTAVQWVAVVAALAAYALTVPCWLTLGSNWSLAVVPGKTTKLVTDGLYRRVRHPIYSLGLLLMLATVAVIPSVAMFAAALMHLTLVLLKCRSEEAHLRRRHPEQYAEYCAASGRFFPRLRSIARTPVNAPNSWRDAA